jgi:hypothetical protein
VEYAIRVTKSEGVVAPKIGLKAAWGQEDTSRDLGKSIHVTYAQIYTKKSQ